MDAGCDALLSFAAAHRLEVEVTVRGRWQGEAFIPQGRSRIRGRVARLASPPHFGEEPIEEYQVHCDGQRWVFRPHELIELKVIWTLPRKPGTVPPEPGKVALRCPVCACIASYATTSDIVQCTNCRKQLRVPRRGDKPGR